MKKILILIFSICYIVAVGQVTKYKTDNFRSRLYIDGAWSDWSDFEECVFLVVLDADNAQLTTYSKKVWTYDEVGALNKYTDKDGDDVQEMSAIDNDGRKCTIKLIYLNSQKGREQLYLFYDTFAIVYDIRPL